VEQKPGPAALLEPGDRGLELSPGLRQTPERRQQTGPIQAERGDELLLPARVRRDDGQRLAEQALRLDQPALAPAQAAEQIEGLAQARRVAGLQTLEVEGLHGQGLGGAEAAALQLEVGEAADGSGQPQVRLGAGEDDLQRRLPAVPLGPQPPDALGVELPPDRERLPQARTGLFVLPPEDGEPSPPPLDPAQASGSAPLAAQCAGDVPILPGRLVEPSRLLEPGGERRAGVQGLGALGAVQLGGESDRVLEQRQREVDPAEPEVHVAEHVQHLDLDVRPRVELAEAFGGEVEDRGIGVGRDDLGQIRLHPLRAIGLVLRPVALAGDLPRLHGGGRRVADHQQREERRRRRRGPVALQELPQPVGAVAVAHRDRPPGEVAVDVLEHPFDRGVAGLRLLAQRRHHDGVEVAAEPAPQGAGRKARAGGTGRRRAAGDGARPRRDPAADRLLDLGQAAAVERVRVPSAQQLVEQQAELINVRGGGDRLAENLLGAGVLGREDAGEGARERLSWPARRREHLGDAEVQQLDLTVAGDDDVRRLEVAVDHQVAVRVLHRAADLTEQLEPLVHRQPLLIAVAVDRATFDVLHDHERPPVRGAAAVDQPGDARVTERGQDLTLLLEPQQDLVGVGPRPQQLDGDGLLELTVGALGQIDRAHAAAAQLPQQAPGADPRAGRVRRPLPGEAAGELAPQRSRGQGVRLERRRRPAGEPEQFLHLRPQAGIAGAGALEPRRPLLGGQVEQLGQQVVDPGAAVRVAAVHGREPGSSVPQPQGSLIYPGRRLPRVLEIGSLRPTPPPRTPIPTWRSRAADSDYRGWRALTDCGRTKERERER